LRRVLHNPIYLESHNPSFRVRLRRYREKPDQESLGKGGGYRIADVEDNVLPIQIETADGARLFEGLLVPNLSVGDKSLLKLPEIMSSPGKVQILLLRFLPDKTDGESYNLPPERLYSYQVHIEAAVWAGAIFLLVAAISGVIGALVERGSLF